jgi:hypothetical protein
MGKWIWEHLWQVGLGLLAVGGWVAQVQGAVNKVEGQQVSLTHVVEELGDVKWSLDSLRLEMRHMNRALDALLVVNGAR